MKKPRLNSRFMAFIVAMGFGAIGAYGQCTINGTAISAFTLNIDNPSGSGISVAYNPDADLYYAVDGGSTNSNTLTFDATGTEVAAGINSGYDFRGVWWNPNTDQLEANAYSGTGIRHCDLDGSSYGLNTGTIILPSGQPDVQSQGDYDWDADEIIYYNGGSIHRYSRTTGAFIGSYPITGLPVATSNLSLHTVGYTGCPGQEIMVYDMVLEAVYTIDKSTGAYANTSNMPGGITYPANWYDISWTNGHVFIRSGTTWSAYEVFPGCQELTITPPDTELCEGEEITLTATSESGEAVTWDMGVTDGVAFAPPVGTTTYTGSTIDEFDCPYTIDILVHALPEVTAAVDTDEICDGESITLTGGGADTYVWDPADVTDGDPYTPDATGLITYTVTGTETATGCENEATIEVTVHELPDVVASVDDDEICIGDTIILTGSGATDYTWDPAEIIDGEAYTPGDLGTVTYTVEGTDDNGCTNEASIDVTINDLPEVTATTSEDTICFGDNITLTGGGATTYTWDPADVTDGDPYTPTTSGTATYTVTGTDDNGCMNTASVDVHVYDEIVITFTTTDEIGGGDGSIELTVSGGAPAYEYDWDNDGTGDFDDTEDLTDLTAGTYVVIVRDENGCTTTETITVDSQVGIDEISTESVLIYPNPTQNNISIVYAGEFQYELNNLNGTHIMSGTGNQTQEISLIDLADGVYFVTIYNSDSAATFKVVKK